MAKKTGRPSGYKPQYPALLLEHLGKGNSFPSFGAVIGKSFDTLYDWVNPESPRFQREFSEAKKEGEALLLKFDEDLGKTGLAGQLRRVVKETIKPDGTREYEYAPTTFNAVAWIFLMKNRHRQFYRDRHDHEVTGKDGGPIEYKVKAKKKLREAMKDEALRNQILELADRLYGDSEEGG
jgi:hypothetical protein